ncbi:DHA2 family efflux MFS transporter permease subunit [Micromonospora sp. WMMA1363]|uniref:DHA2 family efflux MFS transporter permease subunit n=1 Tax=Micromonospora sp. WMMA1363 TaxID=3053985 RepID=UPI00259C8403|nr:DHA2 family efflux MFS transporter permease subunit [Micromonospora sp. WMMA1363]MDM4722463.1 DHA2 family efflux MFS transporter permease subunit [Micromonospora sp. WMMA1363]
MPQHGRGRWWGLLALSLGVAMIIVDVTIVNVAVPAIIRDLDLTATDAQWVQEAYTLVFAALLLVAGRFADRSGRRRMFVAGVVVFVVASVLAATAGSGPALISARVLQGLGGAMMLPTSLSLLNATFTGRQKVTAFAVWGATIGGAAALGPLLGGWLTTEFSWRWAFGINVPVGALVVAGVLALVPESRDAHAERGTDWLGALLSVAGMTGIVFALIEGRTYGWWAREQPFSLFGLHWAAKISPVPVAGLVGLLALATLVAHQVRRNRAGRAALLDLSLFRIGSFRTGVVAAAIVSLGEFGLLFALPLWYQNVLGYSAFDTGLALLPLAVGSFLASGLGAPLVRRWSAVRVVQAGVAAELVGIAGLGLVVAPGTRWWAPLGFLFVYGVGVGLATAQLTGVSLREVPVRRSGQGSGVQSTARQVGSALGIAVLGTVLFASLGAILADRLAGTPGIDPAQRQQIVTAVRESAGAAIGGLAADPRTAPVAEEAKAAFSDATRYAAFAAAGFLLVGLLACARLPKDRPAPSDPPPDREPAATRAG